MRAIFAVLIALGQYASLWGQESTLRWKFAEGASENYRLTQTAELDLVLQSGRNVTTKVDREFEWLWSVSEVEEDGSAWISIEVSAVRLKVTGPSGDETQFDSKSKDEPRGYAATLAPLFRTLMKSELQAHLSPLGEIIEIEVAAQEGTEEDPNAVRSVKIEIPKDLEKVMKTKPVGKAVGTLGKREELLPFVQLSLPQFPQEPIPVGQQWEAEQSRDTVPFGSTIATTVYRLDSIDAEGQSRVATLIPSTELSFLSSDSGAPEVRILEQDCTGRILFDLDVGRPRSCNSKEILKLETQGGRQMATGTLRHELKVEIVDAETDD